MIEEVKIELSQCLLRALGCVCSRIVVEMDGWLGSPASLFRMSFFNSFNVSTICVDGGAILHKIDP